MPSWASNPNAERSASGFPDASITIGTSDGPSVGAQRGRQVVDRDGFHAEPGEGVASPRPGFDGDHPGARPPEQERRQRADDAEAEHDHGLAEQRSGIQRDLQRGFDEREERRVPRLDGSERDNVTGLGDERVLMRLEGEDQRALRELGPALLDDADAAVPVAERVPERAAERADRLVDGQVGIELAAVRQHLGSGADPGERGAHEHLALADGWQVGRPDGDPTRAFEPQGPRHSPSPPVCQEAQFAG